MAESVSCISCRIVYADPEGECHMQLPIFVDPQGALHGSLVAVEAPSEPETLTHICLGDLAAADVDESRREHLQRVLQRALNEDASPPGSPRRQLLQQQLKRLGSFAAGSAEEKDALRRALLSQRSASMNAARQQQQQPFHRPRTCFLTYTEQRLLLSSH